MEFNSHRGVIDYGNYDIDRGFRKKFKKNGSQYFKFDFTNVYNKQ